jgi:hypothetical protein
MKTEIDKPQNVLCEGQTVRILKTDAFDDWLNGLRDRKARLGIDDRIRRVSDGYVMGTWFYDQDWDYEMDCNRYRLPTHLVSSLKRADI